MKVLFLDIDGVLNSAQSAVMYHSDWLRKGKPAGRSLLSSNNWEFCPIAVSNLNYILKEVPDLKIVISSTWRYGKDMPYFVEMFKTLALDETRLIGKTPVMHTRRGFEIQAWLDEKNGTGNMLMPVVTQFVILDDDGDMEHLMPNLVQTSYKTGLSWREVEKILKVFKPEHYQDEEPDLDLC